jgi:hypothetical protein
VDDLEAAIRAGAIAALRRRADRQAKIAKDGMTIGERGVVFRTGEGVLADRLSVVLSQLAAELEEAP